MTGFHGIDPGTAVILDGDSLSLEDLARLARDPRVQVEIDPSAWERVDASRAQIEAIVDRYVEQWEEGREHPVLEYGVTTGFGEFKDIPIAPHALEELQCNILLSHSVGVGETADLNNPSNYFEPDVIRAVLAIRLNAFLKGRSGIRREIICTVQAMLNFGIIPLVPIRGSVGSSGDLCPLAQLFVVLLGESRYYVVKKPSDLPHKTRKLRSGLSQLRKDIHMDIPDLKHKDGLALTNGATFSAALLALAAYDGERLAWTADAAAALSLEAVCGCARAFDSRVHLARGLKGQIDSAENIRKLITGSKLIEKAGAVQDVYSLRCAPAVHGAARDAIAYVLTVAKREINAATDNPLFFATDDIPPFDHTFAANWPQGYDGRERLSYSAGNFHGEPVGMAADVLAIALAELANISERRIEMLLDSNQNRNLPSSLIPNRGINSGLMIVQYAAAGIVSENKVLAHPASVDSIPTSSNSEDHNAMSTIAARKVRTVLRNVQSVLAIELLVAAQAIEWRVAMECSPVLRRDGRPSFLSKWQEAELEARDFEECTDPKRRSKIASELGEGTRQIYVEVRKVAPTMLRDRMLEGDIRGVRKLVERLSLKNM